MSLLRSFEIQKSLTLRLTPEATNIALLRSFEIQKPLSSRLTAGGYEHAAPTEQKFRRNFYRAIMPSKTPINTL